jgi:hypothetical protein
MNKKLIALAVASAVTSQVQAFQFDTGEDWSIRWDNTLKYNLVVRAEDQNKGVLSSNTTADPDLSFDRGDIVSNRFDILSEVDVIFKDRVGFRVSAAGWYDHAYSSDMNQPNSIAPHWTNPSVGVGELNGEAEDLHYRGGELLDAFVFANFDMGSTSANVRLGRHTIYWGQSLFLIGAVHSVGGSMNTIDGIKAFSVPGSEARELFRPTNKISTVFQMTENLTMEAYYSFEWENIRIPEATTFFSPADALTEDAEMIHLLVAPAFPGFDGPVGIGLEMQDDEYSDDGEWGVNFSYYFDSLGLEVSAYYLNYNSKVQDGIIGGINAAQALSVGFFDDAIRAQGLDPAVLKAVFGEAPDLVSAELGQVSIGKAKWMYKEDVDLFGMSFSKDLGGVSLGLDLTARRDTPLRSDLALALQQFNNYPAPLAPALEGLVGPEFDFDNADGNNYPRVPVGDTYHATFNGIGVLNDNGIWQGGSFAFELVLAYLDKVTQGENLLLGTVTPAVSLEDGDTYSNLALAFNPTWFQVFPGVDLTLRTNVNMALHGSAPNGLGGDDQVGLGTVGLEASVNQQWTADIRYNFFFGPQQNGIGAQWKDRDNISLTFKRTF